MCWLLVLAKGQQLYTFSSAFELTLDSARTQKSRWQVQGSTRLRWPLLLNQINAINGAGAPKPINLFPGP